MGYARHYVMIARDDQALELSKALADLATAVRAVPGCQSVEYYQQLDAATHFIFIECWDSLDAHKAGGALLGKVVFAPVFAALAAPPATTALTPCLHL